MALSEPPTQTENDLLAAPSPSHRHRYAGFDDETFSLYSNGSSAQAKRALEAHLAETERRLQEASQLGSSLLHQRTELSSKLKEVQGREDDEDIGPELRHKLVELEREFNEVGREAARAFIPRSRVPSNESAASGEASILETGGRASPSKLQPPSLSSRKQRNAAPSRMNDIELAAEIGSSLLNQMRDLQAAYADKDDALRAALASQSSLESEREGLFLRLRSLDESEQRYKDENWTLETRLQELSSSSKEASDREQKLQQSVKAAHAEKSNIERELEELKQAHGQLTDSHATVRKHHEAELLTLKKDASLSETDRIALQRRIDDLSAQNSELAQAMAYKFRPQDLSAGRELTPEEDDAEAAGLSTPDHSPPPSPTKGTPRHGGLESETLKSSLHHAHRMIQNLKNNIHREKTEKLELRRMLTATQDDLEQQRTGAVASASRKRKGKDDTKEFKKPVRPDKLGVARGATSEILLDDDWEDNDASESPSRAAARHTAAKGAVTDTDAFETANENEGSDDFETATENEPQTESEAFHTGAESLDGDSGGDSTETEGQGRPLMQRIGSRRGHERTRSFQSTASTDDDLADAHTPSGTSQSQKFKLRSGRGTIRSRSFRSNQILTDSPTAAKDPPASVASGASNPSTPNGPSLFAELGELSGSEDEEGTPSRSSVDAASRHTTPERVRKTPLGQRDSLRRTPSKDSKGLLDRSRNVLGAAVAGGLGIALGRSFSQKTVLGSDDEAETPRDAVASTPIRTPVQLSLAPIEAQETEPIEGSTKIAHIHASTLPTATTTAGDSITKSSAKEDIPQPLLARSVIAAQDTVPILPLPKEIVMPTFARSGINTLATNPVSPVKREIVLPALTRSVVATQYTQPITPTRKAIVLPAIARSTIAAQDTTPISPRRKVVVVPAITRTSVVMQDTTPVSPAKKVVVVPAITRIPVVMQDTTPVSPSRKEIIAPVIVPPPVLTRSILAAQDTRPIAPRVKEAVAPIVIPPPQLGKSSIAAQITSPESPKRPKIAPPIIVQPPSLTRSVVTAQDTRPQTPSRREKEIPLLAASTIASLHTEPVTPQPSAKAVAPLAISAVTEHFAQSPIKATFPSPGLPGTAVAGPIFVQDPNKQKLVGTSVASTSQATEQAQPTTPIESERPSTARRLESEAGDVPPPIPPRSPRNRSSTIIQDEPRPTLESRKSSESSRNGILGMLGLARTKTTQKSEIAEDETRTTDLQPTSVDSQNFNKDGPVSQELENVRMPFREIEPNTLRDRDAGKGIVLGKPIEMLKSDTADEGTQTVAFGEDFDPSIQRRNGDNGTALAAPASTSSTVLSQPRVAGVYRPTSPRNRSRESVVLPYSVLPQGVLPKSPRRPGSAGSVRSRAVTPPPLPVDHREAIAAAAQNAPPISVTGTQGVMGPPIMPASAYRSSSQYRTPNSGGRAYGTVRTSIHGVPSGFAPPGSAGTSSAVTRRSSVSSFASEIDERFNIAGGGNLVFDPTVDPRMIQAITQTMIGEFLWKYTRKAGRETASTTRHRRYFWVHPYTRTLYWSEQSPTTAGRAQQKAKSVKIQSVRIVGDDNPFPPGLHRKSLVVSTPGREVQFTAATSSRHEMWFNALSYLLLRTDGEQSSSTGDANGITAEDVAEFNPASRLRGSSRRSRASLASYNSRATRVSQHDHPTLTPNDRPASRRSTGTARRTHSPTAAGSATKDRGSVSSRLSTLAGSFMNGSRSSRHSLRSDGATTVGDATTVHGEGEGSIYTASVVRSSRDSAEDLRREIERQERDADHLENVRACCDGKHDVGSLAHGSMRASHRHSTMVGSRSNSRMDNAGSVNGRTTPHQANTLATAS